MKEHPIIFSTEMVKAILEGRTTMTRRVIKPQPHPTWTRKYENRPYDEDVTRGSVVSQGYLLSCPYGQVGDRLWVRETWAVHEYYNHRKPIDIPQGVTVECRALPELVRTDGNGHRKIREGERGKWRPSIHMPRWASRIDLDITDIRVERLQEINSDECLAEGILASCDDGIGVQGMELDYKFSKLWDSLNAKRGYSWESNPFVWCITFKRFE